MQHPEVSIALESAKLQRTGRRRKRLSVSKRIPEQECIDRLNALDGRKFVRWVGEYNCVGKSRVVMACDHGHEWEASINSLVNSGRGCPKCAGQYRYTEKERIDQISLIKNIKFLGWVGEYKNQRTKAKLRCLIDNHKWSSSVDSIINQGTGCPKCSNVYKYTEIERIDQVNNLKNISFVRWVSQYKDKNSKAVVLCSVHGLCWSASIDALIYAGTGCPKCSCVYRYSEGERIKQINDIDGVTFVEWESCYKNAFSKAIVMCDNGHKWSSCVASLINAGTRCPTCAKSGFSPSKPGDLYLLRSECGLYVKVGISNNHENRVSQLRKRTPYHFDIIEIYHNDDGLVISELESHFHRKYESAGFKGFDGATEWLKFSPELLEEFKNLSR